MRRFPFIAGICIFVSVFVSAAAQDLTVKSATGKAVELEWTKGSSAGSLERSSGQAFQKISPGESGKYTDTSIDPFATYKYRINTAGKFSNEVTVGPPPAGVSNAAPVPKGGRPENYGPATAVALDENGDPLIAFEWIDPNDDADKSDTDVRFVRWDRATYKWAAPVRVAPTGPLSDQAVYPIAVGSDGGTLAVLTMVGDGLIYALSTDHGATWKNTSLSSKTGSPRSIAMAAGGGQAHVVVNGEDAPVYLTGPVADAGSWKSTAIPAGDGWKVRNSANIGLALDAAGKPALAYYEDQQEGDAHQYVFWRPGGAAPATIAGKASSESPDIALTYGNNKFGALFAFQLDSNDGDHVLWYSQSADGSSWSKPAKLPIDGPRSTNPPLAVAIDSKGAITAAFGSNSGSAAASCNAPAVSRSPDGTSWKTCGLGKAAGADFSPQPSTLHVIEAPDDRAYVVWHEESESKYGPGVLVWHGR